ncbi:MAG: hypothetical protein IKR97_06830, partial [Eubacterium sp.]|nr:hypothetical protein [Eubacterium sp.]
SFNFQWNYLSNGERNVDYSDTTSMSDHKSATFPSWVTGDWQMGYANLMYFGDSMGSTEYSRTITPTWGMNFGNNSSDIKKLRIKGSKSIYVVNYKVLKDALGRAKPVARAVTSYKEGGLTSFFTAYDNATSFNPQTAYNWADNTASKVSDCANDISGMVSALDNANKREDIYPVVRTEMKTAHSNHPTGNSAETDYATDSAVLKGTYTKSSVDYFKEVYPVAKSHMYNLVENPYVTSASSLPDIENAHFLDVLADFTALDTAKNTAVANANNAALEDAYTTGSIAALKAYVASTEEFPIEYTADRSDFGISRNSEITAEITKFEASAEAKLDPLADLSELEAAVLQGDGILVALNGARAVYSEDEIGTLITAMNAASPYYNADAATRKTYGTKGENSAQAAIDIVTQNILSAIEALKENDVLSVLQAAIECVEKPDEDVYSVNPEALVLVDTATDSIQGSPANYTSITGAPITIATIDDEATSEDIEGTIANVVSVLNTECVKTYTVSVIGDAEISFTGNGTNYKNRDGSYSATYKNTAVFTSNSGRVAWYMEFDSETSVRSKQYQDSSTVFITPVIGNITVYAVGSTESKPNRITIARNYSNDPDKTPIQLVEYADSTYTLPVAKAIPNYTFDGYYINDVPVSGTIDISGDTDIIAKYTFSGTENCAVNATALEGGTTFNQTVAYNTKVELQGGENAYAWIEEIAPNRFRPFAIGADVSFFVTESIELTAVTQSQFEAYDFSIPAANLRKEGIVLSDSKSIFNAQIVDGGYTVREHGILIGIAKNGGTLSEEDIIVENAGNHEDYNVFRAKSTRFVGANQFTIGVNGLTGKTILYKAYVIYEDSNGKITTVYSEPMNH